MYHNCAQAQQSLSPAISIPGQCLRNILASLHDHVSAGVFALGTSEDLQMHEVDTGTEQAVNRHLP
jgi:hypothetical protein